MWFAVSRAKVDWFAGDISKLIFISPVGEITPEQPGVMSVAYNGTLLRLAFPTCSSSEVHCSGDGTHIK